LRPAGSFRLRCALASQPKAPSHGVAFPLLIRKYGPTGVNRVAAAAARSAGFAWARHDCKRDIWIRTLLMMSFWSMPPFPDRRFLGGLPRANSRSPDGHNSLLAGKKAGNFAETASFLRNPSPKPLQIQCLASEFPTDGAGNYFARAGNFSGLSTGAGNFAQNRSASPRTCGGAGIQSLPSAVVLGRRPWRSWTGSPRSDRSPQLRSLSATVVGRVYHLIELVG
jgi:hypothetical protein